MENFPKRKSSFSPTLAMSKQNQSSCFDFLRCIGFFEWLPGVFDGDLTRVTPILQPNELDIALFRWFQIIQGLHYIAEVAAVAEHGLSHRSQLAKLSPFLDENGVLKVGGRLKLAILPQRTTSNDYPSDIFDILIWLLLESCHRRTLYGEVQLTLGLFCLRFWIQRDQTLVKKLLYRYMTCTRWRVATLKPLHNNSITMDNTYHEDAVSPHRYGYASPILKQGPQAPGTFIAIFICLWKTAHIESLIIRKLSLSHFISRRGLCEDMHSDCKINFVGADRTLRELFLLIIQWLLDCTRCCHWRSQVTFQPSSRTAFRRTMGSCSEIH